MDSKALKYADSASPELFKRHCLAVQKMDLLLANKNITTAGYPHRIWPEVMKLPHEQQVEFVNRFEFFADVCAQAVAGSANLIGDVRLIWWALSKLNVRTPSELFGLVSPNDYIEIYDSNGIQVFRNFEFCTLITYNLQELLLYPWPVLYGRDEKILGQIMHEFVRVFKEGKIITDLKIDNHLAYENRSKSGRSYRVQMKYFAPLFGENNSIPYMFAGSSIERIS